MCEFNLCLSSCFVFSHFLKKRAYVLRTLTSRYMLYYTILYYTILYYTILYYTILYYTILYSTLLYYTILYYTIPYHTILYYTILYYTILYHFSCGNKILHYINYNILDSIVLHRIAPHKLINTDNVHTSLENKAPFLTTPHPTNPAVSFYYIVLNFSQHMGKQLLYIPLSSGVCLRYGMGTD